MIGHFTSFLDSLLSTFISALAEALNVVILFVNNVLIGKGYPFDSFFALGLILWAIGFYSSTAKRILKCKA